MTWAVDSTGPTLVKGAPGTGKSTVALYRARTMLQALRKQGVERPRLLFTTYTNALIASPAAPARTAWARRRPRRGSHGRQSRDVGRGRPTNECHQVVSGHDLLQLLQQAVAARTSRETRCRSGRSRKPSLAWAGYLLEEVSTVIDARCLETVQAYLAAKRPGRRVPLSETQRKPSGPSGRRSTVCSTGTA